MYEKIKNFIIGHKYIFIFISICVILFVFYMFGSRENISDNREPINAIRNELNRAEGTKQDIANTASDITDTSKDLEGTINTASDASSRFDQLINECTNIIEQIREQPSGE